MTEPVLLDLLRQALWVAFIISLPVLTVALAAGLTVGLLQALTSVQEMTLTFVPKLAAIALAFWATMSFSGQALVQFWETTIIPMVIAS